MGKLIVISLLFATGACQQDAEVPTTDDLMTNPQLLGEWQNKCDKGEYSHLPADQKQALCFTTQEAARSVAVSKLNGI